MKYNFKTLKLFKLKFITKLTRESVGKTKYQVVAGSRADA